MRREGIRKLNIRRWLDCLHFPGEQNLPARISAGPADAVLLKRRAATASKLLALDACISCYLLENGGKIYAHLKERMGDETSGRGRERQGRGRK